MPRAPSAVQREYIGGTAPFLSLSKTLLAKQSVGVCHIQPNVLQFLEGELLWGFFKGNWHFFFNAIGVDLGVALQCGHIPSWLCAVSSPSSRACQRSYCGELHACCEHDELTSTLVQALPRVLAFKHLWSLPPFTLPHSAARERREGGAASVQCSKGSILLLFRGKGGDGMKTLAGKGTGKGKQKSSRLASRDSGKTPHW